MTMKLVDAAPNEAVLVDLAEQLSRAESPDQLKRTILHLDESYLEAAKTMLDRLSTESAASKKNYVSLTTEQIESYLEFDPFFTNDAREILKEFVEATETLNRASGR
jgi:hypothetical protein